MTRFLLYIFTKNNQNFNDSAVRGRCINLGSFVGIFCNLLLFAIKIIVGTLSFSVSAIADAFNNLSDIGSSVITAVGYRMSEKPADKKHPFGHGRIEYMTAMLVAVIIILVGIELLKSSFTKVFEPSPLKVEPILIILLALSVAVKFWMFLFNRKVGKLVKSSSLIATAQDSVNDCFATTAVIISVLIYNFWGINIDPYIGIAVAIFIIYSGIMTIKETLDPLLGMPPEQSTIKGITDIVLSNEKFVGIHDLIVHNYGPGRSFASLHVEVPHDVDIVACHEDIDACEKKLIKELGIEVVIHMDPIAVNDERTSLIKNQVAKCLNGLFGGIPMHDFRMVDGEDQINLIFDVVMPSDLKIDEDDLKTIIALECKKLDGRYNTVITVDKDFTSLT